MKWIDYREKLGLGMSDEKKMEIFGNKLSIAFHQFISPFSAFHNIEQWTAIVTEYYYCVGEETVLYDENSVAESIVDDDDVKAIICRFVAFANAFCHHANEDEKQKIVWGVLFKTMEDMNIFYELYEDEDGRFVFPRGAKELDDVLVSELLEWLKDYPGARKTFVIALKQYSEGIYIRDVADNLRKALETFLQEFLGNTKNLESNRKEICKYLGTCGVDSGVTGLFQPLINAYKNLNDRVVKHNDAVDEKLLEFLLYQTGVLIRMALTVRAKAEE